MDTTLSPTEFYQKCRDNNIPKNLWELAYNTYIGERIANSLNKLNSERLEVSNKLNK
jgi:hypothetical protein